ncbi:MAG: ROK family protein [Patescibacteria group bacterium]|nr:ROK family protein [Patescibacteria group bacterium]
MATYSIALDIGATKTAAALLAGNKIIKKVVKPTGAGQNKTKILKNISGLIRSLWIPNVKKIGIGLAGQIDAKKGIVNSTVNFNKDFRQIKLAEILKKEFKVPVSLDNDVKCFAQGELKFGQGRYFNNFLALTFGTGIGGAVIIDQKLYRGKNNLAGEFGHLKIAGTWSGETPLCGCGQKYCFESLASGRAWHKLAKKYGEKSADKIIAPNIAVGLANLATAFNPEAIIVAGGLMDHKGLFEKVRKEFNLKVPYPVLRQTRLIKSKLGENAILLGALL